MPGHRLAVTMVLLLSAAPAAAATPDTVDLTFDWPETLAGRVDYELRSAQVAGDGSEKNTAVDLSYDFSVSPLRDGLLVETSNVDVAVEGGAQGDGPEARIQRFMMEIASTPPAYVVNRNGEFVRVEGMAEFRASIDAGLDDLFADMPAEVRQQVRRAIDQMLSKEQLNAGMVDDWNRGVGAWIGASLERGAVYQLTHASAVPAFGNLQVPMVTTFQFIERTACGEGSTGEDCVLLEMKTSVEDEGFDRALEAFMQQLADANGTRLEVEKFQLDTTIRVITRPETLVPYRIEQTKVSSTIMSVNGQHQAGGQVEEIVMTYTY